MRLTKLEIKGFKSFADRTVVNFDNDITGIVGPNGCGKSNIVDSIRWVLGEQKAKTLRLEKMDNIIFNGTRDRKAGNLAEVALTFDNTRNIIPTEFTTVTISRILHRSGESEYRINGITCRLKDIRDLFLDTGIGSNTYAIMELKMIDDILNDTDNSRRTLIEQAAGVSKYKARKHETILKLKATEADLNRVEDLLYEISNNMKELESQARKALKFKKYKEQYRELSVMLATYDILSINEQYDSIANSMTELEDDRTRLAAGIQQMEAELQQLKSGILTKEKTLSDQQKQLNDFISGIQDRESDKKVYDQKLNFLKNRMEALERQQLGLNREKEQLSADIGVLDQRIAEEELQLADVRQQVEDARTVLDKQREQHLDLKERLDDQKASAFAVRNQLNESEKLLAVRESRLESMKNSIQRSLFEKEERVEELKLLEVRIAGQQEDIRQQQARIIDLEKQEFANAAAIEKLEAKIESYRNTTLQVKRDLDARTNEYRLTRNMVDSLEGFPESIKFLKKEAGWLKDAPLLSDILYCEEKYRVALELALKPWLNHFVVAAEADADRAIELLGSSARGRAHFFVLDRFGKISTDRQVSAEDSLLPAASLVESDDAHRPLLNFLLRGTYIAACERSALPLIKAPYELVVDINGKWIQSMIEVSGGTVGLFEGKRLGRKKNLEKLEKEIAKLKKKAEEADERISGCQQELQGLKQESYRHLIEREREELQQLERTLVAYTSKMEHYRDFVDNQSRRHQEVEGDISAVSGEIGVIRNKHEQALESATIEQHRLEALENDYRAAALELSRFQDRFNESNILCIQRENALQTDRQNLEFKRSRLDAAQSQSAEGMTELKLSGEEVTAIHRSLAGLEEELLRLYAERDERKERLSAFEGNYYELKEHLQQHDEEIRKATRQREETDWKLQQGKEKKNQLKFELQSLQQRLSLEFKIDVEELLDRLEQPELERAELEIKLDRVSRRIDNFGEVNPMAEAAYGEMKKRFDFITEQKDDLLASRESLMATIAEIEETAETQFMESFAAIRENFKEVFRSMFSEQDNCDLVLTDPEQPLESKVEIIAKPKGKRPQSINQLSGGEKSLTSLSLLFALYRYKPAPFCILDEVDAPLDDANVNKFNEAIRKFARDSQFIVVTHNKQTMAAVDVTYGVTMHKPGISLLVPADFRSHKEATPAAMA